METNRVPGGRTFRPRTTGGRDSSTRPCSRIWRWSPWPSPWPPTSRFSPADSGTGCVPGRGASSVGRSTRPSRSCWPGWQWRCCCCCCYRSKLPCYRVRGLETSRHSSSNSRLLRPSPVEKDVTRRKRKRRKSSDTRTISNGVLRCRLKPISRARRSKATDESIEFTHRIIRVLSIASSGASKGRRCRRDDREFQPWPDDDDDVKNR